MSSIINTFLSDKDNLESIDYRYEFKKKVGIKLVGSLIKAGLWKELHAEIVANNQLFDVAALIDAKVLDDGRISACFSNLGSATSAPQFVTYIGSPQSGWETLVDASFEVPGVLLESMFKQITSPDFDIATINIATLTTKQRPSQ